MTNDSTEAWMPLRTVVGRTGIHPETIRAWERRYNIVTPTRSAGGTRRFSEEDVRRLLLVRDLRSAGHSLRKLSNLTTTQLADMVRTEPHTTEPPVKAPDIPPLTPDQRDYLQAIEQLDANKAATLLDALSHEQGNLPLLFGLAIPIMWHVGQQWSQGTLGTAQQRLVRTQLRQLLMSRLERIPTREGAKKLLFTTPAGQLHEFGILAGSVVAAEAGFDVLYLGPNLPMEEIIWSMAQSRADVLVLSVARKMDDDLPQRMKRLVDTLTPRVPIWVGCPPGHPLRSHIPKATCISSVEEFQRAAAALLADDAT